MNKRKKRESSIALPWEGSRGGRLRHWLSGSRAVVFALVTLAALALVLIFRAQEERERERVTRQAIEEARGALERFREEFGRCPRGALELVHPPASGRRFLREMPKDGWGRDLHVECPGYFDPDDVDVISAGPSGSFLTLDNIH